MSALRIERKRTTGRLCANRCQGSGGPRAAVARITLLGYPLPGSGGDPGFYCGVCVDEVRRQYDAALAGEWPDVVSDACACGCGTVVGKRRKFVAGHQHHVQRAGNLPEERQAEVERRRARVRAADRRKARQVPA
jgi:hypothetical protein